MEQSPNLIPSAHRSIRRLTPEESGFGGELVTDAERRRMRVPATGVPDALWELAGAEHIAAVCDVVRTRDGHHVLLPWCTETVETFLARRGAAEQPLLAGEVVTLAGSLLRGLAELGERTASGRWWLDDEARPVFVLGEGPSSAIASSHVLDALREGCADRALGALLTRIADGIPDHRIVARSAVDWERDLTELAAPRALQPAEVSHTALSSASVRTIPVHRARLPQDIEHLTHQPRALRARITALAQSAIDAVREHLPRPTPARGLARAGARADQSGHATAKAPRGRVLLVGAAVTGVVLLGGMLWPDGGEDSEATERMSTSPAAAPADRVETSAPPAPQPSAQSTGAAMGAEVTHDANPAELAAHSLLTRIAQCREQEDAVCADAVGPDNATVLERLPRDGASARVTLIDDYGDVAVLRLAGVQEQMMVIARHKERWLVRDVYDVADQPPAGG